MAVVADLNQDNQNASGGTSAAPTIGTNPTSAVSTGGGSAQSASGGSTPGSSAAPTVGTAPTSATTGASTPSSATNPYAPTSSGSFTNLQNYLNANQNFNASGGGLAGQIGSTLTGQEQSQAGNIQNAQNAWTAANPDTYNPTNTSANIQTLIGNATGGNQGTGDAAQFQQYLNAQNNYVAPTGFDTSQALQGQVNNFQSTANLANTPSGRASLLNQLYGQGGTYGQGQQSLDNLLLQGNSGQLNNLTNTAGNLNQQLQGAYTGANNTVNNLISQYGSDAAATQQAAQQALGNAVTGFQGTAQNEASQLAAQNQAQVQALQSGIQNGTLTQAQQLALGLNGPTLQTFGVNASQYFTPNATPVTEQNAITPAQEAQIQALSNLAGTSAGNTGVNNILQQFSGPSQAGSYGPAFTFNNPAFNQAVATQQAAYSTAANPIQNKLSQDVTNVQSLQAQLAPYLATQQQDIAQGYGPSQTYANTAQVNALQGQVSQAQAQQAAQQAALNNLYTQYGNGFTL